MGIRSRVSERIQQLNMVEFRYFLGVSNPLILEIGANDGSSTEKFTRIFPEAKIHCFEPDARAISLFHKKAFSDRVQLNTCAVCATDGHVSFFASGGAPENVSEEIDISDGWHYSGSIKEPTGHLTAHEWCKFSEAFEIPSTRLDTWVNENLHQDERIDLIWMDVQGAEADVFEGAENTLSRVNYIFTEYSDRELYKDQPNLSKIKSILTEFRVVAIIGGDVLFQNKSLPEKKRSLSRLLFPREFVHQ